MLRRCTILLDVRSLTSPISRIGSAREMYVPAHDRDRLAELRALIARHARPDETTAIDGVLLSAAGRPGEPRASTTGTVMALIAQGAKRLAIGDRVYDYGPGQYLVASVDLPITGHYTQASPTSRRSGSAWSSGRRPSPSLLLDADAGPTARAAPAPRASASPTPRPSSSTPSSAWCACSTAPATATSSRR